MREQWRTIRQILPYYPRVFRLIWQASPRYTLMSLSLASLNALATPAQIWLVKVIIDRVSLLVTTAGPNAPVDWPLVVTPALFLAFVLVVF